MSRKPAGTPVSSLSAIGKLQASHHKILQLHLLGYTQAEISEQTNYSIAVVSKVIRSSEGRQLLSEMNSAAAIETVDIKKRIDELLPKAIETLEGIMTGAEVPASTRLRAAQDLLNRGGFAPVQKIQSQSTSLSLTVEDLEKMKERAIRVNPAVIRALDITPEEG